MALYWAIPLKLIVEPGAWNHETPVCLYIISGHPMGEDDPEEAALKMVVNEA